ncbi:Glycosyltransferase involved in cell wall biogenesis [Candidatus Terasakiella magnetica]|nr:Glycosyltransferase involved in cell wall biogenesis [Candidatus Terasakiella magnetica]
MRIAVVIPCYRVSRHIEAVLAGIPPLVHHILVVDDCCPDGSGDIAAASSDPRVEVLRHSVNKGVGGAVITGYRRARALECDIVIKMDGDDQMDPAHLPRLIAPLAADRADYAKGNRFCHYHELKTMPPVRLFGNSALSFLVKLASGQWGVMDPSNGYTAIHRRALDELELERLAPRYFFESDMLIQLGIAGLPVEDVAMPARYGDETSSLAVGKVAREFPPLLLKGFLRRLLIRYFVGDFNIASLYLLIGLPLLAFGIVTGLVQWGESVVTGVVRSAGTVMLVAMPTILGFQLLLQAIAYDVQAAPKPRPSSDPSGSR